MDVERAFFFLSPSLRKLTPIWSPLTQASSQRRYARPVDDSSRKNSFRCKPSTEPSTVSLAPVSETSSMVQSRRQVPSMPIICAAVPRSKVIRSPLRRSVTMMPILSRSADTAEGRTFAGRLKAAWLTGCKSRNRLGQMRTVPGTHHRQRRMFQRTHQIAPDPRLMLQIVRLAIAPVEPREGAEQPRVPLCREDRVVFGESGGIEGSVIRPARG